MIMPIHKPSAKEKLFFFVSGAIISTPFPLLVNFGAVVILGRNLPADIATFLIIVVIGPLIEEYAKAYPLFYRHGETEKSLMMLGFLAGLGFGIAEFFLYLYVFEAPLLVRLPALFFHASNTVIVSYGIARHKSVRALLLAVSLHALNNFAAREGAWPIGGLVAIGFSYFLAIFFYAKSSDELLET